MKCLVLSILCIMPIYASTASPTKIQTLYNSLDTQSVAQHLAFYELYSHTSEGKQALQDALKLLSGNTYNTSSELPIEIISDAGIDGLIALITKGTGEELPILSEQHLNLIDRLAARLQNRQLKGRTVQTEAAVIDTPSDQIDLARSLFLTQLGEKDLQRVRTYEALIDLMALQILAKLSPEATPEQKIRIMNDFIFTEMGFRFPPTSQYAKDIDLYTFLPSVLDARRGVCLGVSILYICIAQRLGLPLEMITPPGHIYVRYRQGNNIINIETTARGVHVDCSEYLGINTSSLQERTVKEVIGLAHFNQASVFWQKENYQEALNSYKKALPYLPNDKLLWELMGYTHLFVGQKEQGEYYLKQLINYIPNEAVFGETVISDYLNGNVTIEGIKIIYNTVDEKRESLLKKKSLLEDLMKRYPNFRAGWFTLGILWLQLHRHGEAIEALEQYTRLEPNDPTCNYYLAVLFQERFHYNKAWHYLHLAEQYLKNKNHHPKALQASKRQLSALCPE